MGDCLPFPDPELPKLDTCSACPPGTFAAAFGGPLCLPCPAGTANPTFGATACSPCPSRDAAIDNVMYLFEVPVDVPYYAALPTTPLKYEQAWKGTSQWEQWESRDPESLAAGIVAELEQVFGAAECFECPPIGTPFGACVAETDCRYPGCQDPMTPHMGGKCVDGTCMMPGDGETARCPFSVDVCVAEPTPAPTRPPVPAPTPKPTKAREVVQCTIAMVIDEAAVEAMMANPAAAQEALAAGYSEYLGIEPEKIEICYTSPDVGIYGDCEGTELPPDIAAKKAAARGGSTEEVPGDSSDSSTSTSTTTGGSSGREESAPA